MAACWNGQQLDLDLAARTFNNSVQERTKAQLGWKMKVLPLELVYNRLQLFLVSKIFYFLSFLLILGSLITPRFSLQRISFVLIILGFLPHTIAILVRIVILQRPPVSNLYETFIFVGFVSVLTGLFIERRTKKGIGSVVASISGFVFLMIAGKFSVEGDTLKMLVAVLNSNFWLSTHVISITIGYSGVCVAGLVGHIYILQAIFKSKNQVLLNSTHRLLIGTLGFGLTATFLGTNLGGIWADQSWGRFWGWDPKENGALLIVLWTAILFHAKIARIIGPLGVAVGSVFGIIVVMWAWFGVNLLSVGLHSYGFTSGLARNLVIYVSLQLLFLIIAFPIAQRKIGKNKI